MPYLPELNPEETVFPKAQARDLSMQIRMIEELFRRQCPATPYYQLLVKPTPTSVTATGDRTPVGAAGASVSDPLYNERLPVGATEWKQAQGTAGATPATETQVFDRPVLLNFRRQKVAKEVQLKRYGFDKIRELMVFVPLSLLDTAGITVCHGDKLIWNKQSFMVKDFNTTGYWQNSDISLYMALNCDHYRLGA